MPHFPNCTVANFELQFWQQKLRHLWTVWLGYRIMSSWHPSRPKLNEFSCWLARMAIYNCCRAHPLHFFPIPLFSKKHFPTDFKVTQVKSRKQKLLNETPEELVVANGSNFDILLPLISLGNSPRGLFWLLWRPLNIKKVGQNHGLTVRRVRFS